MKRALSFAALLSLALTAAPSLAGEFNLTAKM